MWIEAPKISSYGSYKCDNYGAHTIKVKIGEVTIWYSYKTPIAFEVYGRCALVRENEWGPTTAKHMGFAVAEMGVPGISWYVPSEEFVDKLDDALNWCKLEQVKKTNERRRELRKTRGVKVERKRPTRFSRLIV